MTFVVVGALLGGLISGLIMKSIFGGIAFAVLLILFFVLWRYMKNEEKTPRVVKKSEDTPSTPPVSVNNVSSSQTTDTTIPQNPQ